MLPIISFPTTTARKSTIAPFDEANFQLQNRIFQLSNVQLCVFTSNEQEPASCDYTKSAPAVCGYPE